MYSGQPIIGKHPLPSTSPQQQSVEPDRKRLRTENGSVPQSILNTLQDRIDISLNRLAGVINSLPSDSSGTPSILGNRVSHSLDDSSSSTPSRLFPQTVPLDISVPRMGQNQANIPSDSIDTQFTPSFTPVYWYEVFQVALTTLRQDPDNFQALIEIANACKNLGMKESFEKYEKDIVNKAHKLREEAKWGESLNILNAFFNLINGNEASTYIKPFALFCKADVLRSLGRARESLDAANESLSILMERYPQANDLMSEVWISISKAHQDLGEWDASLKAVNQAVLTCPNNDYSLVLECEVSALTGKAEYLRGQGQLHESLLTVDRALSIQSDNRKAISCKIDGLLDFVYLFIGESRYYEVLLYVDSALSLQPEIVPLLKLLGQKLFVLRKVNRTEQAIEVCKHAIGICDHERMEHVRAVAAGSPINRISQEHLSKVLVMFTNAIIELKK